MLEFQIDASEFLKAQQQISFFPKLYKKASSIAAQRALTAMRAKIIEGTTQRYYKKASEIRKASKLSRVNLIFRGPILSLRDYYLTPRKRKKRQNGLRGAVMRAGGIKNFPRGFLISLGGRDMPYLRTGYRRGENHWENIKPIPAPAIPQIVKNPDTLNEAQSHAQEIFSKTFKHEMLRQMGMIK